MKYGMRIASAELPKSAIWPKGVAASVRVRKEGIPIQVAAEEGGSVDWHKDERCQEKRAPEHLATNDFSEIAGEEDKNKYASP